MITYNPRDPHDMAAAQREYDEIAEGFVNEDFKEYSEEKLDVECPQCGASTTNYNCTHCQQRGT